MHFDSLHSQGGHVVGLISFWSPTFHTMKLKFFCSTDSASGLTVWTDAVSVHSPDWSGFLLCTIFLTWQTSLPHPPSRHPQLHFCWGREALSSTILSFMILTSSNLLLVVPSSPMELSTPRSSLMKSFLALFVKLVTVSSIVCAHRSCWSSSAFWAFSAFWAHNPVEQLLHFMCR